MSDPLYSHQHWSDEQLAERFRTFLSGLDEGEDERLVWALESILMDSENEQLIEVSAGSLCILQALAVLGLMEMRSIRRQEQADKN